MFTGGIVRSRSDEIAIGDAIRTPLKRSQGIRERWRIITELETTHGGFIRVQFNQWEGTEKRYFERWTIVPPWQEWDHKRRDATP
jgi:hypothetical protein